MKFRLFSPKIAENSQKDFAASSAPRNHHFLKFSAPSAPKMYGFLKKIGAFGAEKVLIRPPDAPLIYIYIYIYIYIAELNLGEGIPVSGVPNSTLLGMEGNKNSTFLAPKASKMVKMSFLRHRRCRENV